MNELWSPLKAAFAVFLIVCVVGLVVALVAVSVSGNLHDQPFMRGQKLGQGIGTFAAVCAVIAYFVQAKRRG